MTCPVGTLEPGASQSLVVTVALSTDLTPGELANTPSADSPTVDPDPETRIATASVQVTVESDLEIIKTTLTDPVVAGQPVTYRFDVVNQGPSAAPDVADQRPALRWDLVRIVDRSAGVVRRR